jgi:hypothetical protein
MRPQPVLTKIGATILVLAAAQIASADLSENLVAHWTFAGNANDVSAHGNDGIVYGASLTTDRFGNPNGAYTFDGANDYIDCGNGPSTLFDSTDSFTLTAWMKYSGLPTFGAIAARHDDRKPTFNYAIGVAHGKLVSAADQARIGSYWLLSSADLIEDVWYHVAYAYDSTSMTLYVNGQEQGSAVFGYSGAGDSIAKFLIGNTGDWPGYTDNRYFNGIIDDLAVYNRALTDAEIRDLSVVPVPRAALLGVLGLGCAGLRLRRGSQLAPHR